MLFSPQVSENVKAHWCQVTEAQQRSANFWQAAWQVPYGKLASAYETAVKFDAPEYWSALNDCARRLREVMAKADGGEENLLFIKLINLTDSIDSALEQAGCVPANLIPRERNELIERIIQLEGQVEEEQRRAVLERELQERLAAAIENLGKSKRAIQINVVNVDPASIIALIRDALEALKHGIDLLNDERFTTLLRKRALVAWLSAKKFVQATRSRFAALKRPWRRSTTLDEFEGKEPDFRLEQGSRRSRKCVALVIGNGAYKHAPTLTNPTNDAHAIGAALARLGFSGAKPQFNLDYNDLRRALKSLRTEADGADMVVIYFAGHGIEVDGGNFLIPVDAELKQPRDVEFETVSLDQVLAVMGGQRQLSLAIIDACRKSPFRDRLMRSDQISSVSPGLRYVEPQANMLVAYAAKHGTFAIDGEGRLSPYAEALLRHIEKPGVEIVQLFREVREDVRDRTRGMQEPHLYGALGREAIYLTQSDIPIY